VEVWSKDEKSSVKGITCGTGFVCAKPMLVTNKHIANMEMDNLVL
jgi:hypothetical protein